MMDWLTSHALAVQAIAAIVTIVLTSALVGTTIAYVREARKARKAAEISAEAARDGLALSKRQYDSLNDLGPDRVREGLLDAKRIIVFWTAQIGPSRYDKFLIPETSDLVRHQLFDVINSARLISPELPNLIWQIIGYLRNAKSEFDKIRNGVVFSAGGPAPHLESASALIDATLEKLTVPKASLP